MKITILALKNIETVLTKLLSQDLSITVSFKLAKLAKIMEDEIGQKSVYEQERVKLIHKYGKEDDKGQIAVSDDNRQSFMIDLETLLTQEIEIDYEPVKVSDSTEVKLSAFEVNALSKFIN